MRTSFPLMLLLCFLLGKVTHRAYESYRSDQARQNTHDTRVYKDLDQQLQVWCDRFNLVKPSLVLRLNRTNEGSYHKNTIVVLVTLETFLKREDIILTIMAHEFGHHYLGIKHPEFNPPEQEILSDVVAKDLIGYETLIRVLKSEDRPGDETHMSIQDRLRFLEENKERKLLK